MIKSILLAGTMIVAAPAAAQTAPATAPTAATPAQTAPAAAPTGTTVPTTAPQAATSSQQVAPVDTPPAQAADAAPATSPSQSQVAQVVEQQFATYDKDGNGALSKAEFSAWMTALKSQSATAPKETPAQAIAWNDAAFKQADGDKSATVTKTELTGFLVKGASQAS